MHIEDEIENTIELENPTIKSNISLDDYIQLIHSKCEKMIPYIKKQEKVSNEQLQLPTIHTCDILARNNYNLQQLKQFAKSYKLKISGNKNELVNRIYVFLRLSKQVIPIQKMFRGCIQRKYNALHGPAFMKRQLCTNTTDFLTIEDMSHLPYQQFFSFKDVDGFIYGFDLISLYNLIMKSGKMLKNPYNRNGIPPQVIKDIKHLIKLSKTLNIQIDLEIEDQSSLVSPQKTVQMRAIDLFQTIDSLGNYSNAQWFLSLNLVKLTRFLRELADIWTYRAQLDEEIKRLICPPVGNPFRPQNIHQLSNEQDIDTKRIGILKIMENFVKLGVERDHNSLGAYYVLGALTLVNSEAATALPWLFQSFSYF